MRHIKENFIAKINQNSCSKAREIHLVMALWEALSLIRAHPLRGGRVLGGTIREKMSPLDRNPTTNKSFSPPSSSSSSHNSACLRPRALRSMCYCPEPPSARDRHAATPMSNLHHCGVTPPNPAPRAADILGRRHADSLLVWGRGWTGAPRTKLIRKLPNT